MVRAPRGQERRRDEPVVTAADHDRVVPVPLQLRHIESPFKLVEAATRPRSTRVADPTEFVPSG